MGILCSDDEISPRPWVPRSLKQMGMSAEEVEVDNFCREVVNTLNKVTPQNYDILLDKMANLKLHSEFYIEKLVKYIINKALGEPLYSELYADMCCTLNQVVDRCISSYDEPNTDSMTTEVHDISLGVFKRLMVKECHLAFDEVFKSDYHKLSEQYLLHRHRQKMFGAMQFIGQLFNVDFIQDAMLLQMFTRLLNDNDTLEFQIECLCILLQTVGAIIESQRKKNAVEQCFRELGMKMSQNLFCSRVKFAVMDVVELRANGWVSRRLIETPMTIDELRDTYVSNVIKRRRKKKKQKN